MHERARVIAAVSLRGVKNGLWQRRPSDYCNPRTRYLSPSGPDGTKRLHTTLSIPNRFEYRCDARFIKNNGIFRSLSSASTIERTDAVHDHQESAIHKSASDLKKLFDSKSPHAPKGADRILQRLEDERIQASLFECYYWALQCWCRTKRKGAEVRIDQLFQRLQEECSNRPPDDLESQMLQTSMMNILNAYHHASNAHRAEELLLLFADAFDDPSLVTMEMCKSVLSTWSRSDSSRRSIRAEKFLSLMDKDEALPEPDITCYTLVLNCWASSNKRNAPEKAELLLRSMEYNENKKTRPNMMSYTCVLNAWSRSERRDAPRNAERLFHEMQEAKGWEPDRVVFNAMISTWGRSRDPDAIWKAEQYFQLLKDSGTQTDLGAREEDGESSPGPRATVVEYSALIQSWANFVVDNVAESHRAIDRVEELLEELMSHYFEARILGDHEMANMLRPNRMTFASVFRTIGSARRISNREERAKTALEKMQKLNLEPTAYILGLVDKCARHATKSKKRNVATGNTISDNGGHLRR